MSTTSQFTIPADASRLPTTLPSLFERMRLGEKLVMVTTAEESGEGQIEDYVHVDWGPSFQASHQAAFPHLSSPGVSISHGPLALLYLARVGGTGYFRLSAVRPYLADGRLKRVGGAPEFSYSVHMVHAGRVEPGLIDRVRRGFQVSSSG